MWHLAACEHAERVAVHQRGLLRMTWKTRGPQEHEVGVTQLSESPPLSQASEPLGLPSTKFPLNC